MFKVFLTLLFFGSTLAAGIIEKPFVVVIPSYKNKDWYKKNLESVLNQKYSNFRIIYLNDASPDGMGKNIKKWIKKRDLNYKVLNLSLPEGNIEEATQKFAAAVNRKKKFFTLINNQIRVGALCNLYRAIQSCDDNEIIVTIDGDDWLNHRNVLKELNETYSRNEVWLTHGNLIHYPDSSATWCEAIPESVIETNSFRTFKCASHLRTFYTWLFKKIELQDLLFNGKFYSMTWDMAIMFPMLEMCGNRHAFISKPNYVYNVANQINDNKVNAQLQRDLDAYIRSLPPYKKLDQHK